MQSFFVISGEHEELARDEIISIAKSYDKRSKIKADQRLVILQSKVSWKKISERATFLRYAGVLVGRFHDITDIKIPVRKPKTFVCRTINLSSRNIPELEKQAGSILQKRWNAKVSLANPHLTVYLIITEKEQFFGYADRQIGSVLPKKAVKYPHELDEKLARCMVNLSGVKKEDTICDPFCGTGTILLQANSMGIKSVGLDFDPVMCKITKQNLAANKFKSKVINSDYNKLTKIKFDALVTDLPYGTSSKSSVPPKKLLQDFLSILPKRTRLVMVYKKGLKPKELSKAKKYEIYRHKSLTRVIVVR